MSEELNKKSSRAMKWSSVTEIIAKLIVPIVNIFLARLLAPDAFGAVATINMIITFAEVFTDAGFQKYIVQHEFSSEKELNDSTNVAFWTNFGLSSLIVVVIAIFRNELAALVGSSELGNAIAVASLTILMVAFSSIQMARFKRDFDFKSLFWVRIIGSFIPLLVTVPLALVYRNFWALVIGTLVQNVFNAVVLTIISKWKPRFFYNFKILKEMFSFTFWTLIESIVIWLTVNIDIFIVGSKLTDYYLGIYKTAMSTVNSYMHIISSAVLPVLFSTLSRYQKDDILFKQTFLNFQKYTAVLVIPMSVGIFVFRDFVTNILLGEQWEEAAGFIGVWGLMSGLSVVFSNFASEVYRSKGNPRLSTIAQLIQIATLVPTVLITVNYGFEVLYTARSILRIQSVIISVIFLCLIYKFNIFKMLLNVAPSIVSALIMGVVGWFVRQIFSSLGWQILSVLICIIIYFASLLLLFPKIRRELFEIPKIKKILSRFRRKSAEKS